MLVSRKPAAISPDALVALLLVAMLLLGGLVTAASWLACRHRGREKTIVNENPDYWSYTYEPDEWEVPRDQVAFSTAERLGTGSFGRVYRGVVRSLNTPAARYIGRCEDVPVAVKSVNDKVRSAVAVLLHFLFLWLYLPSTFLVSFDNLSSNFDKFAFI